MASIASLEDAREYFQQLPPQLEIYFDDDYQRAFDNVIQALEQFFDIASTINYQARENQVITQLEATEIGEHGFTLLLKLIDLMEKLDLPHKRQEIEQVSLIFARWIIRYHGRLNHIEPLVNAFAHAANNMQDQKSLRALVELMNMVVDSSSDEIKYDFDSTSLYRPWRLLLINRGIIATRTHDTELMQKVFDEMILYLPQDASAFFSEGMEEMDELEYPLNVRQMIEHYHLNQPKIKLH
jgi:hypothetical protein